MITAEGHLLAAWVGMLFGVLSGAALGLFFHRDAWAGGYGSFPRRMLRLAHVSCFGLALVNLAFGLTGKAVALAEGPAAVASSGLLLGLVTMPVCCVLTAWRKPFRHAFPVPVLGVLTGIVSVLAGWPRS